MIDVDSPSVSSRKRRHGRVPAGSGKPPSSARKASKVAFHLVLVLVGLILITPGLWMLAASLMTQTEVFSGSILPAAPQFSNYVDIFTEFHFGLFFRNSVIVTGSVVILNVAFCSLTGYALAKFEFPGRRLLFAFILITVMIPFTAIVIPLYLVVQQVGWIDSYQGLIIPFAITSLGVFLMRQFMMGIHDDYLNAARVDGASEFTIFLRIVLPMSKPVLVTVAILTFITNWDEFFWPLVTTTSDAYRTIPIGLAKLQQTGASTSTQWQLIMAAAVVAVVPLLILFLALRKQFMAATAGLSGLNE